MAALLLLLLQVLLPASFILQRQNGRGAQVSVGAAVMAVLQPALSAGIRSLRSESVDPFGLPGVLRTSSGSPRSPLENGLLVVGCHKPRY